MSTDLLHSPIASPLYLNSANVRDKDLPALTSLRFFAATMVVVMHMSEILNVETDRVRGLALWQGVSFFFVLSGFILSYVHPQLEDSKAKRDFLFARFARIWPSHGVAFVAFVCAFPPATQIPHLVLTAICNLTLTQSWTFSRPIYGSFNTPSWSLSDEFFFYLMFPFLMQHLARTWRWKLLLTLGLAIISMGLTIYSSLPAFPCYGNSLPALINVNPLCRLFEFMLGIATYRAFEIMRDRFKPGVGIATVCEAAALMFVACSVCLPRWWCGSQSLALLEPLRAWFSCGGGSAISYALVILLAALDRGRLFKALSLKPFIFLGKASFSLYLFHYPILIYLATHPALSSFLPKPLFILLTFLGCLFAAALNMKIVEEPLRKLLLNCYRSASSRSSALDVSAPKAV